MTGTSCEDEKSCVIFNALPKKDNEFNRAARLATEKGEEFPGSVSSLCGGCIKRKIIDAALSQRTIDLFSH